MRDARLIEALLILALAGSLVASCEPSGTDASQEVERDVSRRSPEVFVADGAVSVVYAKGVRAEEASYEVRQPYPAEELLSAVARQLRMLGWESALDLYDNPQISTGQVRGWTEYIDATVSPPLSVASWIGEWRHRSGDVIRYTLQYHGPERDWLKVWIHREVDPAPPSRELLEKLRAATMKAAEERDE